MAGVPGLFICSMARPAPDQHSHRFARRRQHRQRRRDGPVRRQLRGDQPRLDQRPGRRSGAVTWGSGTAGVSGAVSATNSLVGTTANDNVGSGGVTVLSDGNYVVTSPDWSNGAAADAGAVTWGSGTAGVSGAVSATNSLVGSTANDNVGTDNTNTATAGWSFSDNGVTALCDGNYVVDSPNWANGAAASAGAVTWGSGTAGVSGAVSATNSLVGSTANDEVGGGIGGVTALYNGNYVVTAPTGPTARPPVRARSRGAAARPASAVPSVPRTVSLAVRRMTRSAAATTAPA